MGVVFSLKSFWIMSDCCIIAPVSHCAQQIINGSLWPCCSYKWSWEVTPSQGKYIDRRGGFEDDFCSNKQKSKFILPNNGKKLLDVKLQYKEILPLFDLLQTHTIIFTLKHWIFQKTMGTCFTLSPCTGRASQLVCVSSFMYRITDSHPHLGIW